MATANKEEEMLEVNPYSNTTYSTDHQVLQYL